MAPRFSGFERFGDELARLRGRMRALFADDRARTGLSEMELTVLTATVNAGARPTAAQIGRSLGHPRQVVQRAANRLAELDLLRFEENPEHKRASLLVATKHGRALKAAYQARTKATTDALLVRVDAAEFSAAAERLHAIRGQIELFLRERDR